MTGYVIAIILTTTALKLMRVNRISNTANKSKVLQLGAKSLIYTTVISLFTASTTFAAPPKLDYLYPAGASRGGHISISAGGTFSSWPVQAWVEPAQGVTIKPEKESGKLNVKVDADATPGTRWLRLYNDQGASSLQPIIIGTLPEISENKDARKIVNGMEAQDITSSVVVNGKLGKPGEVDVYRVMLKKEQTLVAAVDAHRTLGSPIDPSMQICDSRGFVIQEVDDTLGLDPRIVYTASRDGGMLIRIFAFPSKPSSTIAFTGAESHVYRLTLTTGGVIDHVLPLAIRGKKAASISVYGWNIPDKVRQLTIQPRGTDASLTAFQPQLANVFPIKQIDAPSYTASALPKSPLLPPFAVSGRIASSHDKAQFQFHAKKGKTLRLQITSRQLGFPLDAVLRIEDKSGKVIIEKDDIGKDARDPMLDFKPPADGIYTATVEDLHGRGGFRYVYCLEVEPVIPDFQLTVAKDVYIGVHSKPVEIMVNVQRLDGFKGEITVSLKGLPDSITGDTVISKEKGATTKAITLQIKLPANSAAKTWQGPIQIVGKAIGTQERVATFATSVPGLSHHAVWLTLQRSTK